MKIEKVELVKNVNIMNIEETYTFPLQNVMKIYYSNGKCRVLDLVCNKDITDVNKLIVVYNDYTKTKTLFEEEKN